MAARSTHRAGGALRVGLGDRRRRLRCSAGVTDRGCATGMTAERRGPCAGPKHRSRTRTRRLIPPPWSCTGTSRSWLQKAGSVRRSGRVSVRDRGNETTLLDLLNTRRSGQSRTPGYPSRDLSQTASGTVRCDFTASRTPKPSQSVLGILHHARAVERRPRVQGLSAHSSTRSAFKARTKQCGWAPCTFVRQLRSVCSPTANAASLRSIGPDAGPQEIG
jgi:hypothetical protein